MGHTDHEHPSTTVIKERTGMSGVLVAIIAIILVLFLIWAVFFSGWVLNRDDDAGTQDTTNIEQREGDTNVNVPPADESDTTNQNEPAPAQSPGY